MVIELQEELGFRVNHSCEKFLQKWDVAVASTDPKTRFGLLKVLEWHRI